MRDLPEDGDALIRVDMDIEIGVPPGFKGRVARKLMDLAMWLGLDMRIRPIEQTASRIGDLPTAVRDKLTVDLLTRPRGARFLFEELRDDET